MLASKHIECSRVWFIILMWDEPKDIYMWMPNEKWKDVDWSKPSMWIASEAQREWRRATKNLHKYRNHEFRLLCMHECGEMELIASLIINR